MQREMKYQKRQKCCFKILFIFVIYTISSVAIVVIMFLSYLNFVRKQLEGLIPNIFTYIQLEYNLVYLQQLSSVLSSFLCFFKAEISKKRQRYQNSGQELEKIK